MKADSYGKSVTDVLDTPNCDLNGSSSSSSSVAKKFLNKTATVNSLSTVWKSRPKSNLSTPNGMPNGYVTHHNHPNHHPPASPHYPQNHYHNYQHQHHHQYHPHHHHQQQQQQAVEMSPKQQNSVNSVIPMSNVTRFDNRLSTNSNVKEKRRKPYYLQPSKSNKINGFKSREGDFESRPNSRFPLNKYNKFKTDLSQRHVTKPSVRHSQNDTFSRSKDVGSDCQSTSTPNINIQNHNSNRYHILSFQQVKQLDEIMEYPITICPRPPSRGCIYLNYNIIPRPVPYCFGSSLPNSTHSCPVAPDSVSPNVQQYAEDSTNTTTGTRFTRTTSAVSTKTDVDTTTTSATDDDNVDTINTDTIKTSANEDSCAKPNRSNCEEPNENLGTKTELSISSCLDHESALEEKLGSEKSSDSGLGMSSTSSFSCIKTSGSNTGTTAASTTTNSTMITNSSTKPSASGSKGLSHDSAPVHLCPVHYPCLPSIRIQLRKLIHTIRNRLMEAKIPVREIRLNGGAASCIIASESKESFSDLDLIFRVDLSNPSTCAKIKSVVFASVAHFLADAFAMQKLSCSCSQLQSRNYCCSSCCCCCLNCCDQCQGDLTRPDKEDQAHLHPRLCNCSQCYGSLNSRQTNPTNLSRNAQQPEPTKSESEDISLDKKTGYINPGTQSEKSQSRNIGNPLSYPPQPFNCSMPNPLPTHFGSSFSSCDASHPFSRSGGRGGGGGGGTGSISGNSSTGSRCPAPHDEAVVKQYIQKMVRIYKPTSKSTDSWSLFSLGYRTPDGDKTVDMKFVDRMHRQFEFTVDSFQIVLDSLLSFYDTARQPMNENFYPVVVAESVSGSFTEALTHLQDRIIATHRPEEIRGGGLLKYCKLLVEGYRPSDTIDAVSMERYMCSRFFIDFPDIVSQHHQLNYYLLNHFDRDNSVKATYLQILHEVVSHSTICLMKHERQQTLCLIRMFLQDVLSQMEVCQPAVHLQEFSSENWALDKVFYGTTYFPKQMYIPSEVIEHSDPSWTASVTKEASRVHIVSADLSSTNGTNSTNEALYQLEETVESPATNGTSPYERGQFECPNPERKILPAIDENCESNGLTGIDETPETPSSTTDQLQDVITISTPEDANKELVNSLEDDNCAYSYQTDPNTENLQSTECASRIYYVPQLVTYFPTPELFPLSPANDNPSLSGPSYDSLVYPNMSTLAASMPHYHLGLILPTSAESEPGSMGPYANIPSTYSPYVYPKYFNGYDTSANKYGYCNPFYYLPNDQSFYMYPAQTVTDPNTMLYTYSM